MGRGVERDQGVDLGLVAVGPCLPHQDIRTIRVLGSARPLRASSGSTARRSAAAICATAHLAHREPRRWPRRGRFDLDGRGTGADARTRRRALTEFDSCGGSTGRDWSGCGGASKPTASSARSRDGGGDERWRCADSSHGRELGAYCEPGNPEVGGHGGTRTSNSPAYGTRRRDITRGAVGRAPSACGWSCRDSGRWRASRRTGHQCEQWTLRPGSRRDGEEAL